MFKIFKKLYFFIVSLYFFVTFGYVILSGYLGNISIAQVEGEKIPYYDEILENTTLLFTINETKTLFNLDFQKEELNILFCDREEGYYIKGYAVDFYVEADYDLICGIIDNLGGIEIEINNEKLNYTGTQIIDLLKIENLISREDLIKKIVEKIANNGFYREDFIYIIENSETNITIPDCYDWEIYIKNLCKNENFIQ